MKPEELDQVKNTAAGSAELPARFDSQGRALDDLDDKGNPFPIGFDPDRKWREEDLPEEYAHDLAIRNGELLALGESTEEAPWIRALRDFERNGRYHGIVV